MDRKVKVGDKLVAMKNELYRVDVGDKFIVNRLHSRGFFALTDSRAILYFYNNDIGDLLAFADEAEETEAQPLTYREQLAEKIFVAAMFDGDGLLPTLAFTAADSFIEERDRQRQRDSSAMGSTVDISV